MGIHIPNKRVFYQLASIGLCGNTPKTWNSWHEYLNDKKACHYMRHVLGVRRLISQHKILTPGIEACLILRYLNNNGISEGTYILTEVPQLSEDKLRTLQGELTWVNGQWELFYTHTGGYMRKALAEDGHIIQGWQALRLLKGHCTPSDYSDLMLLFEQYTIDIPPYYPVIEFSVLRNNIGCIKGRNTLIWEVRHY